jgi:hypothetical protein
MSSNSNLSIFKKKKKKKKKALKMKIYDLVFKKSQIITTQSVPEQVNLEQRHPHDSP